MALFIGLSSLLPESLRALCSCAQLFFARVIACNSSTGTLEVEIAALDRYFSTNDATYRRHVRQMTCTEEQFEQMLEWDRCLASMATCDVRELVEEHAQSLCGARSLPPVAASTPVEMDRNRVIEEEIEIEQSPETVIIPLSVIREALVDDTAYQRLGKKFRPSCWSLPRMLVRTALTWIKQQKEEAKKYLSLGLHKEEQIARLSELRQQGNRLHRALQCREVPVQVQFLPVYGRGKHGPISGCRIDVDVPAAA